MPLIQKQRSYAHEKALEKRGLALGYRRSERAFASRGAALGHDERVDVVWEGHDSLPDLTLQSKRMKKYPVWLQGYIDALDGADLVVMRQDRGHDLALLPLERLIALLHAREAQEGSRERSERESSNASLCEGRAQPSQADPRTSPALRSRRVFLGRPA